MAFLFKIQIKGITQPPVWRKVLVPVQFSFAQFHEVIQMAFGWQDYHLFQFSPHGFGNHPTIGILDPENEWEEEEIVDCETIELNKIFKKEGQKFTYIYDFGDHWQHQITLEKIIDNDLLKADCVDGKGACPPEDCGGISGYESLKEILRYPKHEEYEDMIAWLEIDENEIWDAKYFDLEEAKEAVREV
jgi:hypothetical protein